MSLLRENKKDLLKFEFNLLCFNIFPDIWLSLYSPVLSKYVGVNHEFFSVYQTSQLAASATGIYLRLPVVSITYIIKPINIKQHSPQPRSKNDIKKGVIFHIYIYKKNIRNIPLIP